MKSHGCQSGPRVPATLANTVVFKDGVPVVEGGAAEVETGGLDRGVSESAS